MSATEYELVTIKDIFDKVPAERINDCCKELGQMLTQARYQLQMVEAAAAVVLGEEINMAEAFKFPDSVTWTDDGKGEITTSMVDGEGAQLLSIVARPCEAEGGEMSADRELLELAAKSGGYEHCRYCEAHMAMIPENEGEDVLPFSVWNPLTDDGDALRLAAELKMNVCLHTTPVHVYADMPNRDVVTDACYRRAITRAAAEIGRSMA